MTGNADYFSIFGVPPGFDLDPAALERKFYELSRLHHPDRFSRAPAAERAQALTRMSELNEAYRTLKEPELLREYVLRRAGFEGAKAPAPMELAEAWFETQEALAEGPAHAGPALTAFEARLAAERGRTLARVADLERELTVELRGAGPAPAKLQALHEQAQLLNYLASMGRDLARVRAQLGAA